MFPMSFQTRRSKHRDQCSALRAPRKQAVLHSRPCRLKAHEATRASLSMGFQPNKFLESQRTACRCQPEVWSADIGAHALIDGHQWPCVGAGCVDVASGRQFTFEGVHGPPLFKARSPRSYTVPAESGATHATVAVAATILLPVVKHFPYKNLYVYRLRPQNLILQLADCGSREPTPSPELPETAKMAILTFSVFDPRLQG